MSNQVVYSHQSVKRTPGDCVFLFGAKTPAQSLVIFDAVVQKPITSLRIKVRMDAFLLLTRSPALVVACVRTVKTTTWFEEHLSEDNQEFMRKSAAEEYRRQTADKLNPLKDEPWQRHQWTEGGSLAAGGSRAPPPDGADFFLLFLSFFIHPPPLTPSPRQPAVTVRSNLLLSAGSRRVGLVAVKLGMAPIWTKTGERHAVTMLQVLPDTRCHCTSHTVHTSVGPAASKCLANRFAR